MTPPSPPPKRIKHAILCEDLRHLNCFSTNIIIAIYVINSALLNKYKNVCMIIQESNIFHKRHFTDKKT